MRKVSEIIRGRARLQNRKAAGQGFGPESVSGEAGERMSARKSRRERCPGRVAVWAAVLCAVLLLPGTGSRAADGYGYTVTFYPGNHGTFGDAGQVSVDNHASGSEYRVAYGEDAVTVSGLAAGDVVSFDAAMEGAVDSGGESKYYVKGIRQGGRDNSTVDTSAFRVEGDRDYVVAYGIRGNMTSYVVNYQDEDGNTLAPSRTYYGNVGDKPVIAFLYIEGYQPQAYNLTKTLSANAAENVFTFVYTRVREPGTDRDPGAGDGQGGTGESGNETATGTPGPPGGNGQPGGQGAGNQEGNQPGSQDAGNQGGNQTGGQDAGNQGGNQTGGQDAGNQEGNQPGAGDNLPEAPAEPQDIRDLDEQPVPLAGNGPEETKSLSGLPLAVAAGILTVLAAAGVGYVLYRRKKAEHPGKKDRR